MRAAYLRVHTSIKYIYYFYVSLYGTRFARVRPGNVACSESFVCVYSEGNVIKWGFNWNSQNIFKEFTKTINEYLQYLLKLYEQFTEVDHLHTNRIMNGPCPFLRTYTGFNYFQSVYHVKNSLAFLRREEFIIIV